MSGYIFDEHIARLHMAVSDFFNDKYSTGRDAKLKEIAMEICLDDGGKPERIVQGDPGAAFERVIKGMDGLTGHGEMYLAPLWYHYIRQAGSALTVIERYQ